MPFLRVALLLLLLAPAGCATTPLPEDPSDRLPAPARAIHLLYDKGLNHLSAVRSGSCPMHPSCSQYSREAFGRHGFIRGWWMTFDRLLRCGRDEMDRAPRILVRGTWKAYDPVARNDHWWHDP